MTCHTIAAAKNPWQPYDKGGGKSGGVIPEAGTYGLAFVGFCLLFVLLARLDNREVHPTDPDPKPREVRWDDSPSSVNVSELCGWTLVAGLGVLAFIVAACIFKF